ncbi:MAG: hypothetical protein BWY76_02119 [bacterium ADurb.Bin429]|nr:MAG: hypothetical protein BWY76_02119 [bacterium ADurb.Bin429]
MANCLKCGAEVAEGAQRCASCGAAQGARPAVPPMAGPGMMPPTPMYEQPVEQKTSGLAVASLVLGLLGIFLSCLTTLPGLILGIIALNQINQNPRELGGKGLAIGGIVTSACFMLLLPIMASILFPVFAKAREKARAVTCLSQQRQIATAIQMYVQDNNGLYPPAGDDWAVAIETYAGSSHLFHCPAAALAGSTLAPNYGSNPAVFGKKEADITDPANTIVIGDSDAIDYQLHSPGDLDFSRHDGDCIVGYADGHAAKLSAPPTTLGP